MILVVTSVYSQSHIDTTDVTRQYDQQSLGFGIGVEYGSILGLQYAYYFNDKIGLVASGGLIPQGASAVIGMKYRPWTYNKPKFLSPYLVTMLTPVKGVVANV